MPKLLSVLPLLPQWSNVHTRLSAYTHPLPGVLHRITAPPQGKGRGHPAPAIPSLFFCCRSSSCCSFSCRCRWLLCGAPAAERCEEQTNLLLHNGRKVPRGLSCSKQHSCGRQFSLNNCYLLAMGLSSVSLSLSVSIRLLPLTKLIQ